MNYTYNLLLVLLGQNLSQIYNSALLRGVYAPTFTGTVNL